MSDCKIFMIESFNGHWTGETENAWNWYQNDKLDQWVRMRCSLPLHSLVTSITTSGLGMFFLKMLFKTTRKKTFKMVHQKISSQCKSFTTYFQDIWSNPYTPQKLLQTGKRFTEGASKNFQCSSISHKL